MSTVYQYNLAGEYVGETVAYGGLLPANTTAVAPVLEEGQWPVWQNGAWVNVVDNRQTPYWLDGDSCEVPARYMSALGPLPDGASLEQPEKPAPTTDELADMVRTERDSRITTCDWIISRHAEQIALRADTALTTDEYAAWLAYRQELRDLPLQEGFPWSGGGADDEICPWPSEPTGNAETE